MGQRFKQALLNEAKNKNDGMAGADYDGYACTPADATQLPNGITRALFITGTGNVAGTMADGTTTFLLTGVPANTIVPISASIIASTSTTATGISCLY